MKRIVKKSLLFGMLIAMFTACIDDPEITTNDNKKEEKEGQQPRTTYPLYVSKETFIFSSKPAKETIIIDGGEWFVEEYSCPWIHISPMSGEGNSLVTIEVEANENSEKRDTKIKICNSRFSEIISISQEELNSSYIGNIVETKFSWSTESGVGVKSLVLLQKGFLEAGFCVGIAENPSIENNFCMIGYTQDTKNSSEKGDSAYDNKEIDGFPSNTLCYLRTYVIKKNGEIEYGNQISIELLPEKNFSYPVGTIKGAYFSVGETQYIAFSQGNLQYQASTNTWRLAEHQWDFVGLQIIGTVYENNVKCDNSKISATYEGWIDLFGWGTSGYKKTRPYTTYKKPSDGSPDNSYIYYYMGKGDITGTNYDWGVYNIISNGGNQAGLWRTLTRQEWSYLLHGRKNANCKKGLGEVNGVIGLILLPDNWSLPDGITYTSGFTTYDKEYSTVNSYSLDDWEKMETNGAVFLPAAGYRDGGGFSNRHGGGNYWSSTGVGDDAAVHFYFKQQGIYGSSINRRCGVSVRLVQDVK